MIYFIGELENEKPNGMVKIGYTGTAGPISRLRSFQTGNPRKLQVVGAVTGGSRRDEGLLHSALWEWHRVGEWFELHPEALVVLGDGEWRDTNVPRRIEDLVRVQRLGVQCRAPVLDETAQREVAVFERRRAAVAGDDPTDGAGALPLPLGRSV